MPDNSIPTGKEEVGLDLYAVPKEELEALDVSGGQEQEDLHSRGEDTIVEGLDDAPPSETQNDVAAVIPQPPRAHGERENGMKRPGVVHLPVQEQEVRDGRERRGEHIAKSIIAHGRQEWRLFRRQNRAISNRQHRQWQHESELLQQWMDTCTSDTKACRQESMKIGACFQTMATYAAEMMEAQRADTALTERHVKVNESLAALQMELLRAKITHFNAGNAMGQAGGSDLHWPSKRPKAQCKGNLTQETPTQVGGGILP
ncbi:uncharacterized protein LOC121921074 isoform X2 [Sceloporus undulatus]|uniref:uncharacterized protein LOC121921074 isoform X2 n=1 Tax=Sceloporus undulatus TaxID=8520 RepID=UPI001C4B80B4|nr:uncharacterized protein LOC121921074 isoform X2 [Sceloporus undulatus]